MGDYAGSHEHTCDEEVKYVVHEDGSWMLDAGTEDAGALEEGENFYEEGEYDNEEEEYNYEAGINFELEYSYTCDSSQQVAVEGGSEPIRSTSTGHQVVLVEDASDSSKSSKGSKDDNPKLKPKTKKTKGARRQFKHLHEPPLDVSSDPGYGGSSESFHLEEARSMSISLVSSWLEDAALEEHPEDGMHAQHGSIPPQRRPPPRRPPPGADMGAHPSRHSSSLPVPQYEYEAQDCGKTPAWDPSGYEEDHRVALYDASADKYSVYGREAKPLDKALKALRTGALGFASASRSAAIVCGNYSRVAAVAVKSSAMEMKSLAVPVFTPIMQAVLEESKQSLMGPDQDRGRGAPVSSMGGGPGSGPGRGRGRGRGPGGPPMYPMMRAGMPARSRPVMRPGMPAGPRPVMRPGPPGGPRPVMGPGMPTGSRPLMRPGPPGGPRPVMLPVMRPGMSAGPRPAMRPVMRPDMSAGPRPVMRPIMRPSMQTGPGLGMRPVMRPGMRPGMGPPGNQHALARGPSMARGQFQPVEA